MEQFEGHLTRGAALSRVALGLLERRRARHAALAAAAYDPAAQFAPGALAARLEELRAQRQEFRFEHVLGAQPRRNTGPLATYLRGYFQTTRVRPFSYWGTERAVRRSVLGLLTRCLQPRELRAPGLADSLQARALADALAAAQEGRRVHFAPRRVLRADVRELQRERVVVAGAVEAVYCVFDATGALVAGAARPREYAFELELGAAGPAALRLAG